MSLVSLSNHLTVLHSPSFLLGDPHVRWQNAHMMRGSEVNDVSIVTGRIRLPSTFWRQWEGESSASGPWLPVESETTDKGGPTVPNSGSVQLVWVSENGTQVLWISTPYEGGKLHYGVTKVLFSLRKFASHEPILVNTVFRKGTKAPISVISASKKS